MTCLTLIQSVCLRVGLPSPNAVVTSTDSKIQQLLALAIEEGNDLSNRYQWSFLQFPYYFNTIDSELQSGLQIFYQYFMPGSYIVNSTMWNVSTRLPIYGPLSPQQYQQNFVMVPAGPWPQYSIQSDGFHFLPVPPAGQQVTFLYQTKNWVVDSTIPFPSSTGPVQPTLSKFNTDSDSPVFDESLMSLGIIWRWKASKGLPYSEDYAKYERRVSDAMARDGTKPVLSMGQQYRGIEPIAILPSGSWMH